MDYAAHYGFAIQWSQSMSRLKVKAALAVSLLSLTSIPAPSIAATAHNSQAGAYGSTSNGCAPTPYFPEGGCVSSAIEGAVDDDTLPPPARYRLRKPAQPSDE